MSHISSNTAYDSKIIAFDLDGTLSKSKEKISPSISSLLNLLSKKRKILIISGGSFEQYNKQLIPFIEPNENFILLPLEGSERFEYSRKTEKWEMTFKKEFPKDIKKDVVNVLNKIINSGKYDIPSIHEGSYIEDRDTEIAFSALGQNAHIKEKENWDKDHKKRDKIKKEIENEIPNVAVTIGGTTTIEVLTKGWSKAVGLIYYIKQHNYNSKDILFIGDAIFPGGNDYSVFERDIKCIKVNGPQDTEMILEKILLQDSTPKSDNPIAYFSMEYALDHNPLMYAGGLGVLSGDYLLQASKDKVPLIAFGLKYSDAPPDDFFELKDKNGNIVLISIPIEQDIVKAKVWQRNIDKDGIVKLYLFDTDVKENNEFDKKITRNLYDPIFLSRLKQQIVLGIGSIRLIKYLEINPSIYHLNEGHTSFVGFAILNEMPISECTKIVGTKHTILPESGLFIKYIDLKNILEQYCNNNKKDINNLFDMGKYEGDPELFSTTKFLMKISVRSNGVSIPHVDFEKKAHPNSKLIPITNGVYIDRWQSKELRNINSITNEELANIRKRLRSVMIDFVKEKTGITLNKNICTLVWARRFAMYKRPYLLFSDEERIMNILLNKHYPMQIIISGKPHEADIEGQKIMNKIIELEKNPKIKGRLAYIKGYSTEISENLVKGADIWINTPEMGKEACGTSGMKSGLNGAVQLTVPDGWAGEVNWNGMGYVLPQDDPKEILYDLLENEIAPSFYEKSLDKSENKEYVSEKWLQMSRSTIELVMGNYTTDRMLSEYIQKLYHL